MSLVVLGSARGGPGVTTLALAVAGWLHDAVVVEADPCGGVLALRYQLGREPGLLTLAADRRAGPDDVLAHAQRLPGGVPVLVGPESPEQARLLWRRAGIHLVKALTGLDRPVLVDAGRLDLTEHSDTLLPAASLVLLVVRRRAEELVAAAQRMRALAGVATVALVLVGDGPYRPADVATQLGADVLAVVPEDKRAAASLEGGGLAPALRRSPLMRAARGLAEALAERLAVDGEARLGVSP